MSIWNAILFGIVQGVTEFFPLSSSAHLSVLSNLFGITSGGFNMDAFSVFVHLGTILSVIILYFAEYGEMLFQTLEFFGGANPAKRLGPTFPSVRLLVMILFAILPVFLVLPLNGYLKDLNTNTIFIGFMLLISGIILELADRMAEGKKTQNSITVLDAIIIGLAQFVAAIPGISRTGTVMTAGIAVGLKRDFAFRFSLLMSVPLMFGAEIIRLIQAMQGGFMLAYVPPCLCGMAAALLAGIVSIKAMVKIVEKGSFHFLAYYCWIAGVLAIILTMIF